MSNASHNAPPAHQRKTVVAIDLGAESCRVSLLRWKQGEPEMVPVHRFPNGPVPHGEHLHWDLDAICAGVEDGLRRAAELAPHGIDSIDSIAVDGWAVDYVRLNHDGQAAAPPFCYRDARTVATAEQAHRRISTQRIYALTGVQPLRINTVYQLYADRLAGDNNALPPAQPWVNLPEYVLHRLGARRVSEYTNATHTGLIDRKTGAWCEEIFAALGLDLAAAPELVPPGTDVGQLRGPLATLPAFRNTRLIAPACHDTASAIAGIAAKHSDWAYISSGTWSLVGAIVPSHCATEAALRRNFTNLGAAAGGVCCHTNVNGMWLMQQCLSHWREQGATLGIDDVIAAAEELDPPNALLDVDDPALLLPGNMPVRINEQRLRNGLATIPESADNAPAFAGLIFHSLAARYATALADLTSITGRRFREVVIVGGGSRNQFLNRLTEQATGLQVSTGHAESSTLGNFAIQLAALKREHANTPLSAAEIRRWTSILKRF